MIPTLDLLSCRIHCSWLRDSIWNGHDVSFPVRHDACSWRGQCHCTRRNLWHQSIRGELLIIICLRAFLIIRSARVFLDVYYFSRLHQNTSDRRRAQRRRLKNWGSMYLCSLSLLQYHLYTLMVLDAHHTGIQAPAAWIISASAMEVDVRAWLQVLEECMQKHNPQWQPSCFLVDDSGAEISAIE